MEIPLEGKKTGLNGHAPNSEVFVKREKEKKSCPNSSDVKFSIARILGETSTDTKDIHEPEDDVISEPTSDVMEDNVQYSWLQCTRYKPPKLQSKKLVWLQNNNRDKTCLWVFATKRDSNKSPQLQRLARKLKIRL